MAKYRRIHMPAPLHEEIKRFVESSHSYQSVDQICREAAEALVKEHKIKEDNPSPGKSKTKWKSANIPVGQYQKIQAWTHTGKTPYASVDEAIRDAVRNIILRHSKLRHRLKN